jgi:uncharacterized peroxidase-related enzyme
MERRFLAELPGRCMEDVRVLDPDSTEGRRYGIQETPALVVLDESGKETSRKVGPADVSAALESQHAGCRARRSHLLRWVEETDPRAGRVYRRFERGEVPDIFKAMSLRPDLMEKVHDLSEKGHFSNGYLDQRTKERIATLVSALNRSPYCLASHKEGLRGLGEQGARVAALSRADLDAAHLAPKERALLEFVRRLTIKPSDVSDRDMERLRNQGWKDEEIFEAAFDASLFALFNRVAATYGLDDSVDLGKP